ncbi:hypothetical protein HDV00_012160 [Rhizophlyctis rosea]|nr:hypothetical protein HDV00_012160 [Rhizophlyctis rosea]
MGGATNPHVYWLAITEIIIFYIGVVLPVVVIMVLFCIYGTALFTGRGLRGALEGPGGLTPLELSRLPTFSFHMPDENEGKLAGDEEAGRGDRMGGAEHEPAVVEVVVEDVKNDTSSPPKPSTPQPPTSPTTPQPTNSSTQTCSICFCDYEPGDRLRELACGHRFHKTCIDPWLLPDKTKNERGHRTCPLCVKEAIRPEDRDPKWVKMQKRREAEERRLRPDMEAAIAASREEAEKRVGEEKKEGKEGEGEGEGKKEEFLMVPGLEGSEDGVGSSSGSVRSEEARHPGREESSSSSSSHAANRTSQSSTPSIQSHPLSDPLSSHAESPDGAKGGDQEGKGKGKRPVS